MKTFVWIIGKPGSGKTSVGDFLVNLNKNIVHYSYGELLKKVQPSPGLEGYTLIDRQRVNEIIIEAGRDYSVVVVDGNPYSQVGFGFIEQIENNFDQVKVVYLDVDDKTALARLHNRGREVLVHDGTTQEDRINNFNQKLLPLIEEYSNDHSVVTIKVEEGDLVEVVAKRVLEEII